MADLIKISDSTSTTSSVVAASCTAVKAAYDRAGTAMKGATSSAAGVAGIVPAPAAGKQASFLRGDGTWVVPTNTTYSTMTAATSSAAGATGLVPAPAAGAQAKFLRGDATWQTIASVATKAYITETWSSGTSWYRKYSDGWIEQGGAMSKLSDNTGTTSLHTPFSNTNYTLLGYIGHHNSSYSQFQWVTKTTTNFSYKSPTTSPSGDWYACGY